MLAFPCALDVLFERAELIGPERPHVVEPGLQGDERLRTQAVDVNARVVLDPLLLDQAAGPEHPQVAVQVGVGNYTIKGTFVLQKPSGHTNYYGLIFGGSDLDNAKQSYTYFLVAQDGTFLIKKREGEATSDVVKKTPNDAVKKPGADGKSTNALEVRVGADKIDYVVNGTVVSSSPKAGTKTDGLVGIRVNHLLEVHIDGFSK